MSEEPYVLLWSKYSADVGMYPYHIESLREYIRDGWENHRAWRKANPRDSSIKVSPEAKKYSHNNLWIVLYVGTEVEAMKTLQRLVERREYAGAEKIIMEII